VAVEGDWPDCHLLDRAVRGYSDGGIREVLESFERWPTWMWANEEVVQNAAVAADAERYDPAMDMAAAVRGDAGP